MLELLEKVPQQYEESLDLVRSFNIKKFKVDNILFCGMGASGVVGDVIKDYLYKELKVPVIVNKNDDIPNFVNNKTLVFVLTYSGKSKETLKCYKKCKAKKAKIITFTANDKLKYDNMFLLPSGMPARVILYYSLFPILVILSRLKLIKDKSREINKALRSIINFKDYKKCEKVAEKLYKKLPVVYSYFNFRSVGYYWKTQLNELSKVFVIQNFFPEVNHNEIEAMNLKNLEFVNLKEAKNDLSSIIYYMYSADVVAYFLSRMNKVDPLKTPVIDKLKKKI
jgi:glucose/mannose-6-phosphate isomerase